MYRNTKITRLVETAVMLALAAVLSEVKLFSMPLGGSVTLCSMLPIALISIKHGLKWGVPVAALYGMIQMALSLAKVVSWGMVWWQTALCLLLDYVLAYTVLGLSGMAAKQGFAGQMTGMVTAVMLRLACHCASSLILFSNWADGFVEVLSAAIAYNAGFLIPDMILMLAVGAVLLKTPVVSKIFKPVGVA
jgi:thiamine transporter